jgi:hypothetical protein|nr:MAG TPA: internal head protein [Caudoviricetes sp.]
MAITFSDFDLSREEDISSGVVTDDAEKDPHEFRDDLSEAEDGVTTSDEIERVAKIVQVVESLESFREDLLKYEDTDASMSREDAMTLGSRIAFTYANHGVPMDYPIHMSTESMSHFGVNRLEASVEQLDYHIDMLSTEAMGIFEKIKKNVADFFGNEMNKLRRMEKHIDNAIERVENSDTWATNEIPVAGGSLLTVGGQFNPQKVFSNLEQLIESELKGKVFNTYIQGLERINDIIGNTTFGDMEIGIKKILDSKLFMLGRPFVETKNGVTNSREQRAFEAFVSDGLQIEMIMPTGVGRLIPETKLMKSGQLGSDVNSKNAGVRRGSFKRIKPLSKEEVIGLLKDYKQVISNALSENEVTTIVKDFIRRVERLTENKPQYEAERQRIREILEEGSAGKTLGAVAHNAIGMPDYTIKLLRALKTGKVAIPLFAIANFYAMPVMARNIILGLQDNADSHVARQSSYQHGKLANFLHGLGVGFLQNFIEYQWGKRTMRFQNLAMTFCYSLMRDAYGGIASVGNALIGLADVHIDSKH